ncbi:MAG: hypothetical protein L3J74_18005 [Bacteroidales bacterium]|nr:hypothetical protein [Bacteroidales bacterium]
MKRIFILLLFMTSLASAQKIILLDKKNNEPISNVSAHTKTNSKLLQY